jgi:hypothetical protein
VLMPFCAGDGTVLSTILGPACVPAGLSWAIATRTIVPSSAETAKTVTTEDIRFVMRASIMVSPLFVEMYDNSFFNRFASQQTE